MISAIISMPQAAVDFDFFKSVESVQAFSCITDGRFDAFEYFNVANKT